jgi:ATP-dependent DNA ligase
MAWTFAPNLSRCASAPSVGLRHKHAGISFNRHFDVEGAIVYRNACALGCEGIVSKRLGSPYRPGRQDCWVKVKNPDAPAVRREAEEDWV